MGEPERFTVGEWLVEPSLDRISRDSEQRNLRPKVMELLVYLAERPRRVVSGDELLDALWADTVVTGESVYRGIAELRQALSTDQDVEYIQTIPKKGYRLVATVEGVENSTAEAAMLRSKHGLIVAAALILGIVALLWVQFAPDREFAGQDRMGIAVLPFVNLTDETGNEYFVDGIAEEVLNLLAQVPELRVISRSSSFTFRDKNIPVPEIARQLDVEFVLEGSIRRNGDVTRITVQLIEARSDSHVWSQHYDHSVEEVFRVQEDVAQAVVGALNEVLSIDVRVQMRSFASDNREAQDAYLRARHLVAQRSTSGLETAVAQLESAIALDAEFGAAYAELAIATLLLTRGEYGNTPFDEANAAARPHIARALALEPELPEAHMSAAYAEILSGRSEEALPYLERAVELNPNHALAHSWLGSAYESVGRYKDYVAITETAVSLDPLGVPSLFNYILNLISQDRMDEAARELEDFATYAPRLAMSLRSEFAPAEHNWSERLFARLQGLQLDPGHMTTRIILTWVFAVVGLEAEALAITEHYFHYPLTHLGKTAEALSRAEELYAGDPYNIGSRADLALALAGAGEFARARPMLEELWQAAGRRVVNSVFAFRFDFAAALIGTRLHEQADISDVLNAVSDDVRRLREAGFNRTFQLSSVDFQEGYVLYLQGDHESGLALMSKASSDGYFINPAEAHLAFLYEDPGFAEIMERQAERQARDRARFLDVVCVDNPYADVWVPEEGTCESAGY